MDLKRRHIELCKTEENFKPEIKAVLRVNALKISDEEFVRRLKRKIRLTKIKNIEHAYYAEADFSLASTPEYLLGLYYIQELASQFAVKVLDPKPTEIIMDLCASPGSKTTQIAQEMNNNGSIITLDLGQRIQKLKNNLERMGVANCIVYKGDAKFFESNLKADKILLDVPCSGNYVIEQDWFRKRTISDIKACAIEQKEILRNAVRLVKKD